MVTRWLLTTVGLCTLLVIPSAHGDIYRWDTGEVIPGTEGIEPGPGVQLVAMGLAYADLVRVDLTGSRLYKSTLHSANLTRANLTDADLQHANLANANLAQANLTRADLWRASLIDADLTEANLTSADLGVANLTGADLSQANLAHAGLYRAHLGDANFTGAVVTGALLGWSLGKEQLYSTGSYEKQNLEGIGLYQSSLTGWVLSGQDLTNADLSESLLTDADLTGAILRNANFESVRGLESVRFDNTTVYNQWTLFPGSFDPVTAGLSFLPSPVGDFDADDVLHLMDIDMLTATIHGRLNPWWLPNAMFDLNSDSIVDTTDHRIWVTDLRWTWFGDANLDGEFSIGDLVQVLAAGKYEEPGSDARCNVYGEWADCTRWAEGDWNGDGVFDSSDMVTAFVDGGYEKGPRPDAAVVPEPNSVLLLLTALIAVVIRRRRL